MRTLRSDAVSTPNAEVLLQRLKGGDASVIGELFDLNRDNLQCMIHLRMDAPLAGRISC